MFCILVRVGVREQSNSLTHWLDLSNIYGSTKVKHRLLYVQDVLTRLL